MSFSYVLLLFLLPLSLQLSQNSQLLTRSTEEIFALFICIAFTVDACKDTYKDFQKHYMTQVEQHNTNEKDIDLVNNEKF